MSEFDPRPVNVRFVVGNVAPGHVSLRVPRLSPGNYRSTYVPRSSIYVRTLFLAENSTNEAWEPCTKSTLFLKAGSIGQSNTLPLWLISVVKGITLMWKIYNRHIMRLIRSYAYCSIILINITLQVRAIHKINERQYSTHLIPHFVLHPYHKLSAILLFPAFGRHYFRTIIY